MQIIMYVKLVLTIVFWLGSSLWWIFLYMERAWKADLLFLKSVTSVFVMINCGKEGADGRNTLLQAIALEPFSHPLEWEKVTDPRGFLNGLKDFLNSMAGCFVEVTISLCYRVVSWAADTIIPKCLVPKVMEVRRLLGLMRGSSWWSTEEDK